MLGIQKVFHQTFIHTIYTFYIENFSFSLMFKIYVLHYISIVCDDVKLFPVTKL